MYYAVDGDDVGRRLERLLLENKPLEAGAFSRAVSADLDWVRRILEGQGASIVFCAGDGLLAESQHELTVGDLVTGPSGTSFSIGVGASSSDSVLALKKAKGLGRSRVETQFTDLSCTP
jgi:hypothetical protein